MIGYQFLGFVAVSVIVLHTWVQEDGLGGGVGGGTNGSNTGTSISLNQHTAFLLLFVVAAALVFSSLYLMIIRAFTKFVMHMTLILSVALNVRLCILCSSVVQLSMIRLPYVFIIGLSDIIVWFGLISPHNI